MATIRVTQRRSSSGSDKRQLDTLRSLGLRRIGHTVEIKDCEQARGMVHAVRHLVESDPEVRTPKASPAPMQASEKGQSK
jgi:large subunit ribosomal protein L30